MEGEGVCGEGERSVWRVRECVERVREHVDG